MNADRIVISVQHLPNPHDLLTEAIERISKAWFAAAKAHTVDHTTCLTVVEELGRAVEQPNVFDAINAVQAVVDKFGIPAKPQNSEEANVVASAPSR